MALHCRLLPVRSPSSGSVPLPLKVDRLADAELGAVDRFENLGDRRLAAHSDLHACRCWWLPAESVTVSLTAV